MEGDCRNCWEFCPNFKPKSIRWRSRKSRQKLNLIQRCTNLILTCWETVAGNYCKALFSVIEPWCCTICKNTTVHSRQECVGSELRRSRRCLLWWPDVKPWLVQSTHATCSVKATGTVQHHLLLPEPARLLYMFGFEFIFIITHSETFYGCQCGWPLHSVMTPCGAETHSLRSSAQSPR